MSRRSILGGFVILVLASAAQAQVAAVVSPSAPVGCPVIVAISNDTGAGVWTGACPFGVRTAAGVPVLSSVPCIGIVIEILPGATFATSWNQLDDFGVQVPPGSYIVDVLVPSVGLVPFPLTIGGDAAVSLGGVPRIGTSRNLELCSPLDGGRGYLMAASLGTFPGIATCAGTVPLAIDRLLAFSLDPANPVFLGFQGTLDAAGRASSPALAIPSDPQLVGITVWLAFVAFDPVAACPITRISAALPVTVQ
jgi:hypothetical protein